MCSFILKVETMRLDILLFLLLLLFANLQLRFKNQSMIVTSATDPLYDNTHFLLICKMTHFCFQIYDKFKLIQQIGWTHRKRQRQYHGSSLIQMMNRALMMTQRVSPFIQPLYIPAPNRSTGSYNPFQFSYIFGNCLELHG